LAADFMGGASVFWSTNIRADFTVTQPTKEFHKQRGILIVLVASIWHSCFKYFTN
jgi:hypothetical protein